MRVPPPIAVGVRLFRGFLQVAAPEGRLHATLLSLALPRIRGLVGPTVATLFARAFFLFRLILFQNHRAVGWRNGLRQAFCRWRLLRQRASGRNWIRGGRCVWRGAARVLHAPAIRRFIVRLAPNFLDDDLVVELVPLLLGTSAA